MTSINKHYQMINKAMNTNGIRAKLLSAYTNELHTKFSVYGFLACPLTDKQIACLLSDNISVDVAYIIGCDVYAGFSFSDAYYANI